MPFFLYNYGDFVLFSVVISVIYSIFQLKNKCAAHYWRVQRISD